MSKNSPKSSAPPKVGGLPKAKIGVPLMEGNTFPTFEAAPPPPKKKG